MCNGDEHACLYKNKKSIMHNKEKDKIISWNNCWCIATYPGFFLFKKGCTPHHQHIIPPHDQTLDAVNQKYFFYAPVFKPDTPNGNKVNQYQHYISVFKPAYQL